MFCIRHPGIHPQRAFRTNTATGWVRLIKTNKHCNVSPINSTKINSHKRDRGTVKLLSYSNVHSVRLDHLYGKLQHFSQGSQLGEDTTRAFWVKHGLYHGLDFNRHLYVLIPPAVRPKQQCDPLHCSTSQNPLGGEGRKKERKKERKRHTHSLVKPFHVLVKHASKTKGLTQVTMLKRLPALNMSPVLGWVRKGRKSSVCPLMCAAVCDRSPLRLRVKPGFKTTQKQLQSHGCSLVNTFEIISSYFIIWGQQSKMAAKAVYIYVHNKSVSH